MYAGMGDMSEGSDGYPSEGDNNSEDEVPVSREVRSRRSRRALTSHAPTGSSSSSGSNDNVIKDIDLRQAVDEKEDIDGDGGSDDDEDDDDEEFVGEDEADDEATLMEAEAQGAGKSSAEELATLRAESELSIEQLRAMYAGMGDMSEGSDGYISEGSVDCEVKSNKVDENSKAVTFTECSTVAVSEKKKDKPESANDDALDVDGAMQRLEKADLQARSIHVSICLMS
jgi:hypothetical protein